MALSYRTRRRISILILVVGLPLYAVAAVSLVAVLPPMNKVIDLFVYVFLGIAWAFPLKSVFMGVGKPDPDAPEDPNA